MNEWIKISKRSPSDTSYKPFNSSKISKSLPKSFDLTAIVSFSLTISMHKHAFCLIFQLSLFTSACLHTPACWQAVPLVFEVRRWAVWATHWDSQVHYIISRRDTVGSRQAGKTASRYYTRSNHPGSSAQVCQKWSQWVSLAVWVMARLKQRDCGGNAEHQRTSAT